MRSCKPDATQNAALQQHELQGGAHSKPNGAGRLVVVGGEAFHPCTLETRIRACLNRMTGLLHEIE